MARFYYGGQAVIEGVMMRGREQATVAVRRPNGELVLHSELLPAALYRSRLGRWPLVRGLVMLWEMLIFGTRMMLFSVNVQARGDAEREIPRELVLLMLTVSLVFVIGIFF